LELIGGNKMPVLTFRYAGEIQSKPRPRATVRGGKASVYNPASYRKWKASRALETDILNEFQVQGIRADLVLYEFGLTDLGKDNDNTCGGVQDAIADAKVFLTDTFMSIPITTILAFPVSQEFTQVTICYQGTEQCFERYFTYRNKRELLSLKLMKAYRKDHLLKGS
jgi:hypothetical protein